MKKLFSIDTWIGIVLMLLSAVFWIISAGFPEAAQMFPRIFLAANFGLSLLLVIVSIQKNKKMPHEALYTKEELLLILQAYVFIAVYIAGVRFIGFYTATTVFLPLFMLFLNVRSIKTLLFVTIGMDAFLYLLFSVGLKLNLPAGLLF